MSRACILLAALGVGSCGDSVIQPDASSDAMTVADAPVDAGPSCVLETANASVTGATPAGPVAFTYGWAGQGGDCYAIGLFFDDEPYVPGDQIGGNSYEPLSITLGGLPGPVVGTHPDAFVVLWSGGQQYGTTGTLTITEQAERITGTFLVTEPGWDLEGTFDVTYCPALFDACI